MKNYIVLKAKNALYVFSEHSKNLQKKIAELISNKTSFCICALEAYLEGKKND